MREHFDTGHFRIMGLKGFIDGVTETHTGMLLEPYEDMPDSCGQGVPLWPKEKMEKEIIAANGKGIQVRLHAIGDGAVRLAIDLYEKSEQVNGKKNSAIRLSILKTLQNRTLTVSGDITSLPPCSRIT